MGAAGRLLQATRTITLFTLLSRVLGLARECLLGYFFGAAGLLSAFRIAWMLPNLSRRLFGEGALSAALIPVLSRAIERDGEQRSRAFLGALLSLLAITLAMGVVLAELVIAGLRAWHDGLSLRLAAVLMPYMLLICLVAVLGGVLNVRRHFAAPAACPVILNVLLIAAMLLGGLWAKLSGEALLYVIAVAALVAGVLQLALTSGTVVAAGFRPSFSKVRKDPHVRAVLKQMAPTVVGLSAMQLNTLADYLIAYWFVVVDGERVGPAVLGFAQYLYQLPLGVFGIAIATAVFPLLSTAAARDDREAFSAAFLRSLRFGLFVSLPAAVGLVVVATPLVAVLFEQGSFGSTDTQRVAGALCFYALGLPAYFAQHILVRAFYARQNTKTPARVALVIVSLNLILNLLLVWTMEERGVALSTSVCAYVQVAVLGWLLRGESVDWPLRSALGWAGRVVVASGIMLAVSRGLLAFTDQSGSWAFGAVRLTVVVLGGVLSYGLSAKLLGIEELHMIGRLGRRKTA